ncbi:MAG: HAD-IIB family hydrolase [SAR324 cluster bacterium]|jgi:hypothetical protein|nr:HAD family hydrolase [Pseudomonadota bacterium]MBP46164.1 HAD family hydrolase [Deltaproteobacteria bacterium]MDP6092719.1 HAD-IIB family hydrolase [SAR324 cluster bacterium]MDP6247854.1 HAD-IIB family hydrolase [SAR324 cluster bacterium]MDP6463863.1 HAD-IIB family hydrolase [SAR324 cluster bacterium]|tara:strand:- start:1828 stop:2634 length:807 start_codon:yes stop_codon:yes gene_type:complete
MRPLKEIPQSLLKSIRFILCDIDDTLTFEGSLPSESFAALHRLKESGFFVIPVTGRPAGWCDHIARFWPVEGVVGENGAFYFQYQHSSRKMIRHFFNDEDQRLHDRERLKVIADQVLLKVPGAALSADQAYREADLAIDFCEDVPPLSVEAVENIVEIFESHGAKAKVSSIHVNGWFGEYDKRSMSLLLLDSIFGINKKEAEEKILFIGDSPNDCPMFETFPVSVGVANVKDFSARLNPAPAWVTQNKGGYGFAEMVDFLLSQLDQKE